MTSVTGEVRRLKQLIEETKRRTDQEEQDKADEILRLKVREDKMM